MSAIQINSVLCAREKCNHQKKCRFLKYEIQKNSFKSFGQNCGRPTNSQKNRICFLRQIIFINYFWVFTGNKNSRSSERLWRICGIFSLLLYFVCCKNATKFFFIETTVLSLFSFRFSRITLFS